MPGSSVVFDAVGLRGVEQAFADHGNHQVMRSIQSMQRKFIRTDASVTVIAG